MIFLGSESQRFAVPFKADIHIAGLVIGVPQLVSCALAIAVVAALSFILKNTKTGRALRTIAENPDTASLLGVEVDKVVPVVFILTGLLAGVAGALFTVNYGSVSPFMGDNVGTKAIAAMVLGGIGSIWGAIAGGLIVGLIETLSIYLFGGDSVQMVVWGLLLAIIIIRPRGLIRNRLGRKRENVMAALRRSAPARGWDAMAMSGYVSGILAILCINLIFAYGIFVPAAAGQINLGGAGFQAIGAYSAGWLSSVAMLPVWLTIPAAMLIAGLIGFLISFPVLRTRGVYMVLATFAFGEAIAGFLLRTDFFGGAIGMVVPAHVEISILVCCAFAVTLLTFYLMATRFGLAMRSINDDEAAAVLMGVNVSAVQVAAFTIGGAFAGLSGALYAHNFSFVEAQYFNSLLSIYVLLFVLIGGVQTAWGPLIGTLVFTLLPEFMRIGGSWRYVVFGAAIVVLMMVRPQGIVTRAMVEQLSPRRWALRRTAVGALHGR